MIVVHLAMGAIIAEEYTCLPIVGRNSDSIEENKPIIVQSQYIQRQRRVILNVIDLYVLHRVALLHLLVEVVRQHRGLAWLAYQHNRCFFSTRSAGWPDDTTTVGKNLPLAVQKAGVDNGIRVRKEVG
jgi:hypothetical protein